MDQQTTEKKGLTSSIKDLAAIVSAIQTLIGAAGAAMAFIRSHGGVDDILVEIAALAFACYIAAWVTLPAALGVMIGLQNLTKRETTLLAALIVSALSVVGGGLFVRYVLFAPGVTDDLDAIGKGFSMLVGLAVVLSPLFVLWYVKGSKPRVDGQVPTR